MHQVFVQGAHCLRNRLVFGLLKTAAVVLLLTLALPVNGAENRAIKSRVAPTYSQIARRMRITGMVKLEATVDADGKVRDVKAVSGNHMLEPAAEDAVRRWRFESGPGDATVDVVVDFELSR